MADPSPDPRPDPALPLRSLQRAASIAIGLIFAGVAIVAVFKSTNQAGTAALLLAAAAFLLIGIQGTALIRFGSGSASVELERRAAAAVQRADEVAEKDPRLALGILEGAAIIEPRIGPAASAMRTVNYENTVRKALERIMREGSAVAAALPPADFKVVTPAGSVLVSVIYRGSSRSLQQTDLAPLVSSRQLEDNVGGLVVANRASSSGVADYIATAAREGVVIEVVTWQDQEDDGNLDEALTRLLSHSSPPQGR